MQTDLRPHFEAKDPAVIAIFERLTSELSKFGPIKIEPHQTSIHIVHKTAFAGVVTRRTFLLLTIKSDTPALGPRVHKSEHTSRNRYHHVVKISNSEEVDKELLGWLKKAWEMSA